MSAHEIDLAASPERAWAALARAADLWGAELERHGEEQGRGRLRLPVTAGARRGWAGGEVGIAPLPEGSRLCFRVDEGEAHVHTPTIAVLVLGAIGALLAMAWPFWPRLLPLAAVGVVLALAAWFLAASRLKSAGPDELLEMVAAVVGEEEARAEI